MYYSNYFDADHMSNSNVFWNMAQVLLEKKILPELGIEINQYYLWSCGARLVVKCSLKVKISTDVLHVFHTKKITSFALWVRPSSCALKRKANPPNIPFSSVTVTN